VSPSTDRLRRRTTPEVAIAPLRETDFEELATQAAGMWRAAYDDMLPPGQVEFMLASRTSHEVLSQYLGARDRWFDIARAGDGTIVGYTSSRKYFRSRLRLEQLYVAQALWGSGLADRLLACSRSRAQRASLSTIDLTVNRNNHRALRFYRRRGFDDVARQRKALGHGYHMDDLVLAAHISRML